MQDHRQRRIHELSPFAFMAAGLRFATDGTISGCPATTRACYSGPTGTAGTGTCRAGAQSCAGNDYGPCAGEILPSTEICNGLDDDGNGVVDDPC